MKMINMIMVAVDFSDYSLAAAKYAARLAKDVGSNLLLTHVINQRDVYMMDKVALRVPEFTAEQYFNENMQYRRERINDLAKKIMSSDIDVETNVRIGVPFKALLEEIKEKKPDLLVMGTKGRSNVVDMIIGSCAQKMFRHSPIPLLSIREN